MTEPAAPAEFKLAPSFPDLDAQDATSSPDRVDPPAPSMRKESGPSGYQRRF
jgi:hypothetical protein